MTALIGLIALVAIALIGWAICEAKYKALPFTHSEAEKEEAEELDEVARAHDYKEQNVRDIMHNNSTNGYSATSNA